MNITLVAIHVDEHTTMSLALSYLVSYAKQDQDIKTHCNFVEKHYHISNDESYILFDIIKTKPDILGFSTYVWNINLCLQMSKKLKELLPNIIIVFGGPENDPSTVQNFNDMPVDFFIMGEGEDTFYRLCKKLLYKSDNFKLEGIAYKTSGDIQWNGKLTFFKDIEHLPSPFLGADFIPQKHIFWETMRGCSYRCRFCHYNKHSPHVRFFPLERIRKELDFFESQAIEQVYVIDPTFNIDCSRAKKILRMIIERNPSTLYHIEIRADMLDEETIDLMKLAHVGYIEIGLQSINQFTMERMNRVTNLDTFSNYIQQMNQKGLYFEIQLIIGLPGDNYKTFKNSVDFCLSLNPPSLAIFDLLLLPGSYFRQHATEFGIVFDEAPPYKIQACDTFSSEEIIESKRLIRNINIILEYARCTLLVLPTMMGVTPTKILELFEEYSTKNGRERLIFENKKDFYEYLSDFLNIFNSNINMDILNEVMRFDFYSADVRSRGNVIHREISFSFCSEDLQEKKPILDENVIAEKIDIDIERLINFSSKETLKAKTPIGYLLYRTQRGTKVAKVSAKVISILKQCQGHKTIRQMIIDYVEEIDGDKKDIESSFMNFFTEAVCEGILHF